MKILIVSDAWYPQINGVVRTLDALRTHLQKAGHEVSLITPDLFKTIPCPTYPEIRLALFPRRRVRKIIDMVAPDAVHIATEGPLGLAARKYCLHRGLPFTTAFHTRFPEYIEARTYIPASLIYHWVRWFHAPAKSVMVATQTVEDDLVRRGFQNIRRWSRGVDTELFRPRDKTFLKGERPISLYMGRVAVEKNINAFLSLSLPGTKYVVGDGPQLASLRDKFKNVQFTGVKTGDELAAHVAAADVFVFPSRTDTFGLVLLEALACGVPVAAYPVAGPLDVIDDSGAGVLSDDLGNAVAQALKITPDACRAHALKFSWARSAQQFLDNLAVFGSKA